MTENEINKIIAEWCGRKANYCRNLNAMREAELHLWDSRSLARSTKPYTGIWAYLSHLQQVVKVGKDGLTANAMLCLMVRARPNQLAESFVRTLGKWR